MNNYFKISILSWLLFFALLGFSDLSIFQAGTLINLMNGVYIGSTDFAELAKKGDIGLGTYNGLGGELVEYGGKFYLADANGNAHQLPLNQKTPFAMVTQFTPQQQFNIDDIRNVDQLERQINKHLASNNLFYVVVVTGNFEYVKARSFVAPKKPYRSLTEVVKTDQRIFYFHHIDGSLIIFKSPGFISPISVPGYHIHFISKDRKKVGHVFDCKIVKAKVYVEQVHKFVLLLPENESFARANLSSVSVKTIVAIERKHR